jgi:ketosteroid isomerase-like protein
MCSCLAILRIHWTATIARDAGPFKAGQQLSAYIAQFISTRDGRIASIETYDCYEPFER